MNIPKRKGKETTIDSAAAEVLIILGEPPAAVDPGDGALDDPSLGQHLEAFLTLGPLDDLKLPGGSGQGLA